MTCPNSKPPGYDLKQSQLLLLISLQSGYGQYARFMHENANCVCGAIQIPQHILNWLMRRIRGDLRAVDEDFCNWITGLTITSYLNYNFYLIIPICRTKNAESGFIHVMHAVIS